MTMQADLRSRLLGQTGAGNRVTWLDRPQGSALPAITLQTITEERAQNLRGFEGLQMARVQLDVWGKSYAEAQTVSDAAIAAVVPAATQGGTTFSRTMIENLRDGQESAETQIFYRKSMDLIIHHSPA